MGKKRWSRKCDKAIMPGGSQSGNTHEECMGSVGYGAYKGAQAGISQRSGTTVNQTRFISRGRFR